MRNLIFISLLFLASRASSSGIRTWADVLSHLDKKPANASVGFIVTDAEAVFSSDASLTSQQLKDFYERALRSSVIPYDTRLVQSRLSALEDLPVLEKLSAEQLFTELNSVEKKLKSSTVFKLPHNEQSAAKMISIVARRALLDAKVQDKILLHFIAGKALYLMSMGGSDNLESFVNMASTTHPNYAEAIEMLGTLNKLKNP
jgi:hypothetical protein